MTAVEFVGVTKSFHRNTRHKLLREHVRHLFRGRKERFYALKNISFGVPAGKGIAIVGSNGAGKSTLLSLMTGLAAPDCGQVLVNGRIGPLLQLGAGFHPDLTGIENVMLNSSLLGISRKRANEILDTVIEFADIGDFIREPLRTYSSGMVMRLAFAVAVHMDPEILIVDEVLSVGDHEFQAKCRRKILELRDGGNTMVCVSHAGFALQQFCDLALWLDHGEVVMSGAFAEVVGAYEART
jgi:ABC-type polysaccharide/polyol phosphate transport system ATPase subunit